MRFFTTSWFNRDEVCTDCRSDERGCPNYAAAREEEARAVRAGDRNFSGIGLAPEDEDFLATRRAARAGRAAADEVR